MLTKLQHAYPKSLYRCDCGTEKRIITAHVNAGRIRSCGCLRREQFRAFAKKGKLTDQQRIEIRERLAKGEKQWYVGHLYGVSQRTVSRVGASR